MCGNPGNVVAQIWCPAALWNLNTMWEQKDDIGSVKVFPRYETQWNVSCFWEENVNTPHLSVLSESFSLYAFDCRVLTAVQSIYCDDYPLLMHHLVVIYSCIPTLTRLSDLSIRYTLCMTSFKPPLFKCLSYFIFWLTSFFFPGREVIYPVVPARYIFSER